MIFHYHAHYIYFNLASRKHSTRFIVCTVDTALQGAVMINSDLVQLFVQGRDVSVAQNGNLQVSNQSAGTRSANDASGSGVAEVLDVSRH